MRILRNHIILSFGLIQPEMIIDYLKCIVSSSTHNDNSHFHNCIPDIFIFRHYALEYYRSLTYEEIDNMYYNMLQTIRERGKYCANAGTFALLPEYTLHVLSIDKNKEDIKKTLSIDKNNPVCKQSEKLNWRSCYLQLGQDLLIAAHLAYIHSLQNISMDYFGWPSIIGTNDRHLNQIFDNGLAENHFHLNGSTRGFDLSWICLMNHPENINTFFSKKSDNDYEKYINNSFTENLSAGIYSGTADNRLSWSERLNVACYLRAVLFLWIHTGRFLCIVPPGKSHFCTYFKV